jgi:hypothetical protein
MIAKLKYVWVEGEEAYCFVAHKKKSTVEFEDDLREIREVINTNLGGYHRDSSTGDFIACPPSFYELVQTYLTEYGYDIYYDFYNEYHIDENQRKCSIQEKIVTTDYSEL